MEVEQNILARSERVVITMSVKLSLNTIEYVEKYRKILKEMMDKMTAAKQTDSISGSFITQMLPHHQAAIEMSENLLQFTTNIPLQNIAVNIISSQTKSIEALTAALPKCCQTLNTPEELCRYREKNSMIVKTMFREMESACTDNNIDANFMREMIPHHRGAVRMSENALCAPLCPELIPVLKAIVSSQKKGIREMQQLLIKELC